MVRTPPPGRSAFKYFKLIHTRWMDNDIYGHVNNVIYYSYFDTVIAEYLMDEGGLSPWDAPVVGMAVETGCRFHSSIRYPEPVEAGLRVAHLGNSSCRYEIGIFKGGAEVASADGHFVHVFVERDNQRPVTIPDEIRDALFRIKT